MNRDIYDHCLAHPIAYRDTDGPNPFGSCLQKHKWNEGTVEEIEAGNFISMFLTVNAIPRGMFDPTWPEYVREGAAPFQGHYFLWDCSATRVLHSTTVMSPTADDLIAMLLCMKRVMGEVGKPTRLQPHQFHIEGQYARHLLWWLRPEELPFSAGALAVS